MGHAGAHDETGSLCELLHELDPSVARALTEVVALYRDHPLWAVWMPRTGRGWVAVRSASSRPPKPEQPMVWVQAPTAARLAGLMRAADAEIVGPRD
jgi:hypothetical protein